MKKNTAQPETIVPAILRAAQAPEPSSATTEADAESQPETEAPAHTMEQDFPNGPGEVLTTEKPVTDMTDAEVRLYYETRLIGRPHTQMSPYDLQVLSRNGEIAAARRSSEERQGEQARLTLVRQRIQQQAERQGMTAYLIECLNRSIPLLRRDEPTDEVRITVTYAGRSIEIGMTDVQEAWNQKTSSKTQLFTRIASELLTLTRDTATQKRNRLNISEGRDWSALTSDIQWKAVLDKLNAAE